MISGVVQGERRSPKYFVGERRVPPSDISTRGNGDTLAFPPSRLAKKCKVYGKLILRKIIEVIATRYTVWEGMGMEKRGEKERGGERLYRAVISLIIGRPVVTHCLGKCGIMWKKVRRNTLECVIFRIASSQVRFSIYNSISFPATTSTDAPGGPVEMGDPSRIYPLPQRRDPSVP